MTNDQAQYWLMYGKYKTDINDLVDEAFDIAIEALSIDIVRCKDCKYHEPPYTEKGRNYCWWFDSCVEDDDYCSYGERGEADDE